METIRQKVCSFRNLYKGLIRCKKGVIWKDSVIVRRINALQTVANLKDKLDNGTYVIAEYSCFQVYEPKKRDIVSTRFIDRMFQSSLVKNYLYHEVQRRFIYPNFACQLDKGTDEAREYLKKMMNKAFRKYGKGAVIIKFDLHNYFGSTPHSLAKAEMRIYIRDDWVYIEVCRIIDSFDQGPDPEVGIGLGSEISQLVELAFLNDIDHFIKEKLGVEFYLRYMDDGILILPDMETAKEVRRQLEQMIEAKHLTLNKKKTQIFSIMQGVKFLGFKYHPTPTGKIIVTLLPASVSKEKRRLRKQVRTLPREKVDQCYASWKSFVEPPKHSKRHPERRIKRNTHSLIKYMDEYYETLWKEQEEHAESSEQRQQCEGTEQG